MEGPSDLLRRRYKLGAKIGEGGMGSVYAAEDTRLKRKIAIKLIAATADTPASQERFRREALAAARIAHPHIAAVQDYLPSEGGEPALIIMELLDGENLASLLRREGALPVARALDIAAQAASALAAAHAAQIVHRDIKPANIYLLRSSAAGDFVKILDFGIAKIAGVRGLTKTDEIVGTVEFMSPEQAMGAATIKPASDVFSLGVVLYLMLCGQLPHAAGSVNEIMIGLAEGTLVPLATRAPHLPPEVIALVDHALARDPEQRLRDGNELLAAIERLRGRQAVAPVKPRMPDGPASSGASGSLQYAVLARLATGGMAELFLARATSEGISRYVVLKQVLPERDLEPRFQKMFLDEARVASQLRHHNIAQVHDVGRLGDALFVAFEFVHGVDVRALHRKHAALGTSIPIGTALHIAAGTAAGLHHAHERRGADQTPLGIVHRDVSPGNIMVSFDGAVKVVDFGIAKAAHRAIKTDQGTLKGKLAYMSPEQCRAASDLDRRSDVFSLGIVLFEMLTGKRLFVRDTDADIMEAIARDPAPPPSSIRREVSPRLDAIVARALERDRDRRYATAAELLEELETAAVKDGIVMSATATGRHLRELFGDPPEPWEGLEGKAGEVITLTSETPAGDGPPTLRDVATAPGHKLQDRLRRTRELRAPGIEDLDTETAHATLIDATTPTVPGGAPTLPGASSGEGAKTLVRVPPPRSVAPVEPPPRSRRTLAIAVAGLALAGAGGLVFALTRGGGTSATPADAAVVTAVTPDAAVDAPPVAVAGPDAAAIDAVEVVLVDASVAPADAAVMVRRDAGPAVPVVSDTELAAAIRTAAAAEDYSTALSKCAKVRAHTAETASTCTLAACGANQAGPARRYAARLSAGRRAAIIQACLARGVAIEP